MKTKIGLQMYTMREHVGDLTQLTDTLKRIQQTGYDCVQMGTPKYMNTNDFKKLLDDTGLTTCTVGGNMNKLLTDIQPIIDEAQILGCNAVFCPTLGADMRTTEDGFKAFSILMNLVGEQLRKEGMTLQYHSHAMEYVRFDSGKTGMDILVENTDPESVYFMPDTHWMQAGGVEPSREITRFKGRINQVHFKDYNVDSNVEGIGDVIKLFAEVGEGNIYWPAVVDACRDANIEYYVVEQDQSRRDIFDSIKISIDNMKKFGL